MDADPYARLRKRELYRNQWLTVEMHEIRHPGGAAGEHVLIVAPSPCAVVVEDGEDLLFARQARFGAQRYVVEIVKGGRDGDETALACAARELREELGIAAREWTPLGRLYEIPSILSDPIEVFLARDLMPATADPEETESIIVERVPIVDALRAAAAGELDDAITVAALFRYAWQRGVIAVARSRDSTDTPVRPDHR